MGSPKLPPHSRFRSLLFGSVVCLAAIGLFRFPPAEYNFYPACPVWTLLHVRCPGCGTTRALAALLHGQLREALRLNALTVCSLPLLLAYAGARRLGLLNSTRQPALQPSPMILTLAAAVVVAFTLARNL